MLEDHLQAKKGTQYESVLNSSINLVERALNEPEMDIKIALAQINYRNLESITNISTKIIAKVLGTKYKKAEVSSPIEHLRKVVKTILFPNERIASYDIYDLKNQIDTPSRLSFQAAYLLGVYLSDLSVQKGYGILLSTPGKNEPFYNDIVCPFMQRLFNADLEVYSKERMKKNSVESFPWREVHIAFHSKGHMDFLRASTLLSTENNTEGVDFENIDLPLDHHRLDQYKLAYFMGILAAAGNLWDKPYKNSPTKTIMHAKNLKKPIASELIRINHELDLELDYSNPASRRHYIHFNEKNLLRMLEIEPDFIISDNQIGLVTNPVHIEYMKYLH